MKRFGEIESNIAKKSNFDLKCNIINIMKENKNTKQIHTEIADSLSSFAVFLLDNFEKEKIEENLVDILCQIKKLEWFYESDVNQLEELALNKLVEEGTKSGDTNG